MPAVSRRNQKAVKKTVRRKSKRNFRKKNTKKNIRKTFRKNRKGLRGGNHLWNVNRWQDAAEWDDINEKMIEWRQDEEHSNLERNKNWRYVNQYEINIDGFDYTGRRVDDCCDQLEGRKIMNDGTPNPDLCKVDSKLMSCDVKDEIDAKLDAEEEKKREADAKAAAAAAAEAKKQQRIAEVNERPFNYEPLTMIKGGKKHYKK